MTGLTYKLFPREETVCLKPERQMNREIPDMLHFIEKIFFTWK